MWLGATNRSISPAAPPPGTALVHGQPFTVLGKGFGTKSRGLSPLLRDTGTDATGTMSTQWSFKYPNAATTNANFNLQNQTAGFSPTGASIGAPHPYVPRIIAGCHGDSTDGSNTNYNVGMGFGFTIPTLPFVIYSSIYHRADPNWVFGCPSPADDNYKNYSFNGAADIYGGSANFYSYLAYGASTGTNLSNANATWQQAYDPPHNPGGFFFPDLNGQGIFRQLVPSVWHAANGWVKEELEWLITTDNTLAGGGRMDGWFSSNAGGYDCSKNVFARIDGSAPNYRGYTDGGPTGGSTFTGTQRWWQVGGYARDHGNRTGNQGANTCINNYRYWADAYVDIGGTAVAGQQVARVLVGNASTYSACTIREPSIPTAWADGSITFNFWKGALPNNSLGYIYVVTETNGVVSARSATIQ